MRPRSMFSSCELRLLGRTANCPAFSQRRPLLHRCEATRARLWLLGVVMVVILFLMIVEVSR